MRLNILLICIVYLFTGCKTTLSGVLLTKDNQPIKPTDGKINIFKINDETDPISMVIDVDNDGSFKTTKNISSGTYLIEPLIPGYATNSMQIKVDENKKIKIYANPIKTKNKFKYNNLKYRKVGIGSGSVSITPPKL